MAEASIDSLTPIAFLEIGAGRTRSSPSVSAGLRAH
jgi:hypothetical protein